MAIGIQNGEFGSSVRAKLNALLTSVTDVFGQGGQTIVSAYDYYCDSRRGSDANDGLTPATAKRTIAAVQALAGGVNGARIGLARGSSWREQLSLTGNDQEVGSYGLVSDARPSLRADDPLVPGLWTLSSGKTYTYQQSIVLPSASGKQWVNAWENGSQLTFVADVTAVEATAGSYTVSTQTNSGGTVSSSTQTIYVHPAANDDPRTNGKLYEYSKRLYGLTSTGQRATIHGIETRRNSHHDGSFVLYGFDNFVFDCAALSGAKHNMFVTSGTVSSCLIQEQYYGTTSADLLVFYGTGVTGKSAMCQYSTLSRSTYNAAANVNAVYSHTDGATNYDTLNVVGCAITNVTNGMNGTTGGPANVNFVGNVLVGTVNAVAYSPTGALTVKNNRITTSATNAGLVNLQTAFTSADISGNQVWTYDPFSIISITPPSGSPTINITNNILYVGNQSAGAPSTPVYVTRGNLTMTGNVFDSAGNWSGRVLDISVTSLVADNNIYAGSQGGQYAVTINGTMLGGGTLSGWSAYKTAANAAGLELNSVTASSGSYAGAVM